MAAAGKIWDGTKWLYKYQVRAAEKKAMKALKKKQREAAKKAKEAEKEAAIKAKKAAREKVLKGAKVTTEKGVKVTKYPFDESVVEKAQTHVGRDWKHKHLDQLDWKKGGAVKKRKPTKEELNKIMKTGGGGKRFREIIENLLAPIKNLPKGVMKTGGKRGAVHRMPDGTLMKGAKHGMKHGGSVKGKCKVDGIAIRGRTRAKHK